MQKLQIQKAPVDVSLSLKDRMDSMLCYSTTWACIDTLFTYRPHAQVIRVSETDLTVQLFQLLRTDSLHGALRADRHEHRRVNAAVGKCEHTRPRLSHRTLRYNPESKRQRRGNRFNSCHVRFTLACATICGRLHFEKLYTISAFTLSPAPCALIGWIG